MTQQTKNPAPRRPSGGLPADPDIAPVLTHHDPYDRGLWRLLFFSLWLCASLMAGLILLPSNTHEHGALQWIGWSLALAIVSMAACVYRLAVHEVLVDLQLRERVFLGLAFLIVLMLPAVFESARVFPDGLLWATPLLIFLAPSPAIARRLLGWLLLGAWLAAFRVDGLLLFMLAAFAVSWLFAVGAIHFTFMGERSGLSGRWAARRVLRNALSVSVPGLAVAVLLYWIWPGHGLGVFDPYGIFDDGGSAGEALIHRVDPIHLTGLIWRGAVALMLTVLLFAALLYLRRLFLNRRRGVMPSELLPGQSARLTYTVAAPTAAPPSLEGRRDALVRLWGRWAAAMKREGFGRLRGETAACYTERLRREHPGCAPPAGMTRLFEKAHYGQAEPTSGEVETMREMVGEELSRQSLRLQTTAESLDDI